MQFSLHRFVAHESSCVQLSTAAKGYGTNVRIYTRIQNICTAAQTNKWQRDGGDMHVRRTCSRSHFHQTF